MPQKKWNEEKLIRAVQQSQALNEVLFKLGLKWNSTTQRYIRGHIQKLKLDTSHFTKKNALTVDKNPHAQVAQSEEHDLSKVAVGGSSPSLGVFSSSSPGLNSLARPLDRAKARELRKEGWSIPQIANEVKARTGLVHGWVADIEVSEEAFNKNRIQTVEMKSKIIQTLREQTNERIVNTEGHHTKEKGDLAVAAVIFALTKQSFIPCHPLTEHAPFDLIAVSKVGKSYRVQVKYSSVKNDVLTVNLASSWSDKHGAHRSSYSENDFDVLAIYCSEPEICCFIPQQIWNQRTSSFSIRISRPLNNNRCLMVSDYLQFPE